MLRCCCVEFRIWWIVFRMLGPVLIFRLQSTSSDKTLLRSTLLWFRTKKCLEFNPKLRPSTPSTFKYLQIPGGTWLVHLTTQAELWSDKSLLGGRGLCQRWPPFSSKFAPRLWQTSSFPSRFSANSILNKSVENTHILDKLWWIMMMGHFKMVFFIVS